MKLKSISVFFNVNKVAAHKNNSDDINERLNNKVDKLVKDTLKNSNSPLIYDNAPYSYYLYNNNQLIKTYYRLLDRNYYSNHNHSRSSDGQLYNIPYTKELLNESRFLDYYDSKILAQLRMGYMQNTPNNFIRQQPICDCDTNVNPTLTVKHFLIECQKDGLIKKRNDLKNNLIEIDGKYNDRLQYLLNPNATDDQKNTLLKTLLYPHLHYTTTNLKFYNNKLIKMYILKMLINYCRYRFPD